LRRKQFGTLRKAQDVLSPQKMNLFICGVAGSIKFYRGEKRYTNKRGHSANILLDLGDGSVAAACKDGNVKLLKDGENAKRLKAHDGRITALILLQEGGFATSSLDNMIKVWWDKELYKALVENRDAVNCLIQLSYNGCLVSGSLDTSIKVWKDYELLKTLTGHLCSVNVLTELNYECFASGSADKTIKIWKDFRCINTLRGHGDLFLNSFNYMMEIFFLSAVIL
jgi:WD40 repeat protein